MLTTETQPRHLFAALAMTAMAVGALTSMMPAPTPEQLMEAPVMRLSPAPEIPMGHRLIPRDPNVIITLASKIKNTWNVAEDEALLIVSTVINKAHDHGMDALLILSLIGKESSFKRKAKSAYGAEGLTQFVPRFHKDIVEGLSKQERLDPATNIRVGMTIFQKYMTRSISVDEALKRYNGSLRHPHGDIYVEKIKDMYQDFLDTLGDNLKVSPTTTARDVVPHSSLQPALSMR